MSPAMAFLVIIFHIALSNRMQIRHRVIVASSLLLACIPPASHQVAVFIYGASEASGASASDTVTDGRSLVGYGRTSGH